MFKSLQILYGHVSFNYNIICNLGIKEHLEKVPAPGATGLTGPTGATGFTGATAFTKPNQEAFLYEFDRWFTDLMWLIFWQFIHAVVV